MRSKGKRTGPSAGGKRGRSGAKLSERRRERHTGKNALKPEFELAKRLPGRSQMERVRAAVCIINGRQSETLALEGFMALFHPEVGRDRVREMVADLKEQGKR